MGPRAAIIALALAGSACAPIPETGNAPASTSLDRAVIVSGGIAASPQRLRLVDVPAPTGPARVLFNGRDLSDWDAWLGYPDPAVTYRDDPEEAQRRGQVHAPILPDRPWPTAAGSSRPARVRVGAAPHVVVPH